jgi:hypothetical protein
MQACHELRVISVAARLFGIFFLCMLSLWCDSPAVAQTVSSVRSFDGSVAPLFNLTGPASLYIDRQGTQGYLYTPGLNFESYNFRNPTTGQAWSGALTTLGPQLSIGLIQGANQPGNAIVLPGPPRPTPPLVDIQSTILDEFP